MSTTTEATRFCINEILVRYWTAGRANASIKIGATQGLAAQKRICEVCKTFVVSRYSYITCFLICRAMSHITGFVIRPLLQGDGCLLGYVAHCDPQGALPPWLVNKVTHSLGPRMVKDLRKASLGYLTWKKTQTHNRKPWRFPEEMTTPRISLELVYPF